VTSRSAVTLSRKKRNLQQFFLQPEHKVTEFAYIRSFLTICKALVHVKTVGIQITISVTTQHIFVHKVIIFIKIFVLLGCYAA